MLEVDLLMLVLLGMDLLCGCVLILFGGLLCYYLWLWGMGIVIVVVVVVLMWYIGGDLLSLFVCFKGGDVEYVLVVSVVMVLLVVEEVVMNVVLGVVMNVVLVLVVVLVVLV